MNASLLSSQVEGISSRIAGYVFENAGTISKSIFAATVS